ncbi:Trk system potassium transporter TrkA [Bythopirellula goksoeyrii]|uniref:Trk system potassium uptake protein TrkA n=1 Tax=Bythopirellula goksoeyrii TaxID=1400387 RepID=A0A5B9QD96_9BACT|nr:Trk system potassium transporter TrkA [Bythopirellula goksoeyrii]QEG34916.1 Trk system potassium uptake protein TrkA [Bythopirellula goksoeyrii]
MRIVVLGAGTVGRSIASLLCLHRHSVTVIDTNPERIRHINENFDVRGITGSAAQSSILFQAGVGSADLCLAVTGIDEVNIVSASMAKAMGANRAVARVYAPVFRDLSTFDYRRHFGIDRLLSLEHLTALELARGIRHPGSVVVESLARGELEVHEVMVSKEKKGVGKALKDLELSKNVRIGSISRDGKTWIAGAEDIIQVGDRLTIIGTRNEIDDVKTMFCSDAGSKQRVVIAGGGETGYHLAYVLEGGHHNVVLIELDRERCDFLASHLKQTTVVNRDATRRAILEEERVSTSDVFVACTGDDEDNIMASVEARDIGAKTIMALVGRPDYAHVVGKLGIDHAVSPREVVAKQVLGFLTNGPIVSKTPLSEGSNLSVLEIDVKEASPATERVLANLGLPPQTLVAAVIREGFASVPGGDYQFATGDTVIALVADEMIELIEKVF